MADLLDHGHIVGDDDHGDPLLLIDLLQQGQNGFGGLGVQGGGGLVAQQHLRVGSQSPGYGDSLLLAAGKLHRVGIGLIRQTHGLQQLLGPFLSLSFGNSCQLHGEADVFQCGALIQQIEALEDHADLATLHAQLLVIQAGQVLAVEFHSAFFRPLQQVDAANQGTLTGTGKSDNAENLALLHLKAYILQRRHLAFAGAEGLGQIFDLNNAVQAIPSRDNKKAVPMRNAQGRS